MSEAGDGSQGSRLIARAVAGDRAAVDELIRLHEPRLMAFVRMRVGPAVLAHESARDVLQDVLLEVARGMTRIEYRGEAAFRAWLYTVAEHRILDRVRYHDRHGSNRAPRESSASGREAERILASSYGSLVEPSQALIRREDLERLEAVFARLDAGDRDLLTLAVVCGLSTREIAMRWGLGEEAVRKRKTRALARLAGLWARAEGPESDRR